MPSHPKSGHRIVGMIPKATVAPSRWIAGTRQTHPYSGSSRQPIFLHSGKLFDSESSLTIGSRDGHQYAVGATAAFEVRDPRRLLINTSSKFILIVGKGIQKRSISKRPNLPQSAWCDEYIKYVFLYIYRQGNMRSKPFPVTIDNPHPGPRTLNG